jgi:dimethylamine/trimethylamine dehydrogenase
MYLGSFMTERDVIELAADHVVLATGSRWRRDGRGRTMRSALPVLEGHVVVPEELFGDTVIESPAVVYDDDHYYVGSAVAELLASRGLRVTYVTSEGKVSAWSEYTGEQSRIHARLLECGVSIAVNMRIDAVCRDHVIARCVYSERQTRIDCGVFIPVTSREPDERLWHSLRNSPISAITRIGDCRAPGLIAQAVYDGHGFARGFGEDDAALTVRRERVTIER